MTPPLPDIPFVDLFCGAGGLSLGLETHQFVPLLAVDHDTSALKTYQSNHPTLPENTVQNADLTNFTLGDVPQVPLVVGGPPCQGFSHANQQRLSDDPRNGLYKQFLRITAATQARLCVMENVPGMAAFAPAIIRDMADIGMAASFFPVDAADYGYPQYRKRIFWLGVREIDSPDKVFQRFAEVLRTPRQTERFVLQDAIGDLPSLRAKTTRNATQLESVDWGFTVGPPLTQETPYRRLINGNVPPLPLYNHKSKFNNARDIEIYGRLQPGEGADAESIRDIMPYKSREHIFKDKFFKLYPDRPCKTITAHMYYDCHMYIHPTQARGLTPREAARIQGFPDQFRFWGSPNEWYRQVGNAVSPLVAWHVGAALRVVFSEFPELLRL